MKKRYLLLIPILLIMIGVFFVLYDEELTEETKAWLVPVEQPPDNEKGLILFEAFDARTQAYKLAVMNPGFGARDSKVANACGQFSAECIVELRKDKTVASRYMPLDADYYERYFELLGYPIITYNPEQLFHPRQSLISATRFSFFNDMLVHSAVHPDTAIDNLKAHRRLLGESHALIDKMIFTATVGIAILGTHMAIGVEHPWANELMNDERFLLAIQPLELQEYSFSKGMAFESRYMLANLNNNEIKSHWYISSKRNASLNYQKVHYQVMVNQSELPSTLFWSSEMPEYEPTWKHTLLFGFRQPELDVYSLYQPYLEATRFLDNRLAVLRAIRRMYLGADPNQHGETAIPGFFWSWSQEQAELCLKQTGTGNTSKMTATVHDMRINPDYCMKVLPVSRG
jgi:hypothetical protein